MADGLSGRRLVGVVPREELRARSRLFQALAAAFPVDFRGMGHRNDPDCTAVIAFEGEYVSRPETGEGAQQRFVVAVPRGARSRRRVDFTSSPDLDSRLRGRTLVDDYVAEAGLVPQGRDQVLAVTEGRPIWIKHAGLTSTSHVVAHAPDDLATHDTLRDHIDPGRFVGLLPLVQFLREVCSAGLWTQPPTRASFVVDDPNLHRPSYGYLRFAEVVSHAREHAYHVTMAMVPADGWYAHRPTVKLFRENADVVSLCVHGNDHRKNEFGRFTSRDAARKALIQAVRRISSFENRTGLPVARVMVPPHEACSPSSMEAMSDVGFEALSLTRPCPWLPHGSGISPYALANGDSMLSGWRMGEWGHGYMPVLIRRQFSEHDHVVLRSFLDQPIILYGHAADFSDGLAPLEAAAEEVNRLPSVEWSSLARMAESNFESRRGGDTLDVRAFSRRIRVSVPAGISRIRLRQREVGDTSVGVVRVRYPSGETQDASDSLIELEAARTSAPLEIVWSAPRVWSDSPHPASAALPTARRVLAEMRDRLGPTLNRR